MARNRSNRGSGPARRGRDDAPQRGDAVEQQPGADQAASTNARPDPAAADPGVAGRTPPAASPSGASTAIPGTPTSPTANPAPASPTTANTTPASSSAPSAPKPSAAAPSAPAATSPATRAVPESRGFNAQAASPAGGTPSGPAARPTSAGTAGGAAAGQRPQGGGPDRPGSGARPPTSGGGRTTSGGSGRSFGAGMLGGVLGGAAVALLVLWYQSGGDELAALQGRVDEVEATVASATGDGGVEALAGRVQALESASGDELVARLEALEAQVEGPGATQAQLEGAEGGEAPDLSGRLAEIEAALEQLPAGDDSQLAQLEQRLAALESSGAAGGAESEAAPDEGTAALQEAVTALQERLAALPEDMASRLSQLDQRLGAAEQAESRLQELSGSVDQLTQKLSADEQQSQELASQIGTLDGRISDAESRLEAAERNRNRATALALIVGQLEAAIDEARPYQTQVQALTAMTQDGAGSDVPGDGAIRQAVSDLEPGAASGVPGIAALRQSFVPVANEIVHAARAPEGDNLINRATDNLMRLVTVRPVGDDVRGDTAEARVARAEAALDKGDLAAAVAELDQLEGRPAEAAADWLAQAKARLGADQAVAQLRTQATELLSEGG
jgi:hypothetical protein